MKSEKLLPIYQGQIMDVNIVSIGSKGDGIAKHKGFTIIVPKGTIGNVYKVQITSIKERYAFAEVI